MLFSWRKPPSEDKAKTTSLTKNKKRDMHDIKALREATGLFDEAMRKRGLEPQAHALVAKHDTWREAVKTLEGLQAERNETAHLIAELTEEQDKENRERAIRRAKQLKATIAEEEDKVRGANEELRLVLSLLPNTPSSDVPEGGDETENKLLREVGKAPQMDFKPKAHDEIGEGLGEMDFPRAAKVAGARFSLLYGNLAKLERALATFMLDTHTEEFGYREVCAPVLVREETLFGSGHLPKFHEDLFKTEDGRYLIPTAETVLTSLHGGEIMEEADLPKRYVAWTNCFRAEAGAAGRDTKGLLRLHQFSKVELVSYTLPDKSHEEHERMTKCAEEILKRLGLSYRVMLLCAGDMGFSAEKTYDLEVWMPAQGVYREISSCSNCGAFQSRRLNARFRRTGVKGTDFPHALNGSGLAVGRTMAALLENGQQKNGSVRLPEVLWHYMGGVKELQSRVTRVS